MNMSWGHSEEREIVDTDKEYTLKLTIEELIRLEEAVKTSLKTAEDMCFLEKQTSAKELDSEYAQQRMERYMRDIEAFRSILRKIDKEV